MNSTRQNSRQLLVIFNIVLLLACNQIKARRVFTGENFWKMLHLVTEASCDVTITNDDLSGGVLTISSAGVYCLAEEINGRLVIDADNITLDLNSKKLTSTIGNGVEVNVGHKNTTIRNGIIESTNHRGIVVNSNSDCCGPTLESLRVQNCAKEAVLFHHVTNGYIKGCDFISSATGLVLDQSTQVVVEDSVASCNDLAGFALHTSSNNCFSKCKAMANGGGDFGELVANNVDRFGFVSTDGCGNVFQECCAEANTIPFFDPIGFCRSVAGFAFVGTETYSKIIDCKSENNWAPYQFDIFEEHTLVKSATPYGILLKSRLHVVDGELELVTAVGLGDESVGGPAVGLGDDIVYSVDWSPDGKYLAVGGDIRGADSKDLRVYVFDPAASNPLTLLAAVDPGSGDTGDDVYSVDWSPDGKYLAVGGAISGGDDKDLRVYAFDPAASNPLTLLTAVDPGSGDTNDFVYSVNWSPDGKYLAVGGSISSGTTDSKDLRVYAFDPAASNPLTLLTAVDPGDVSGGAGGDDIVYSVDWSPDGKYLAVGGDIDGDGGDDKDLRVYAFDPTVSNPLTLLATVDPGVGDADDLVMSVDWSPDGCFLAVGGLIGGAGGDNKDLRVYSFDLSASTTLALVAAVDPGDEPGGAGGYDEVWSVDWSPDGCFLAVGGQIHGAGGDNKDLRVYAFDLSASSTLALVAAVDPGSGDTNDVVYSVDWSPDGCFLAVGGPIRGADSKDLLIYKALDFPTKNVIKRNIVACNCIRAENTDKCGCDESICPKGVGICGTSICNMIMENEAYNNPFNYQFVTNVFDQRFGNMPSLLQNIAFKGCEPVCIPDDCARISKENRAKLCRMQSQTDVIERKLDALLIAMDS